MKGFQLPDEYWRFNYETMVGYIRAKDAKGKQDPWPPLGFRIGKDLWRDSHALFQTVVDNCQRPRNISWLNDLRQFGYLNRKQVQIDVAGMSADRAKIFFWRHETLPLPLAYLDNVQLVESLKEALRLAERVARILKAATYEAVIQIKKALAPIKSDEAIRALDFTEGNDRSPKRRPDPIGNSVKSLAPDRDYWAQLEPRFRDFLERLTLAPDDDGRRMQLGAWFHQDLTPLAERAYAAIARALTKSQRDLHGAAVGEHYLSRRLRKLGKRYPKPDSSRTETPHA